MHSGIYPTPEGMELSWVSDSYPFVDSRNQKDCVERVHRFFLFGPKTHFYGCYGAYCIVHCISI